jgi:hypothetical protein
LPIRRGVVIGFLAGLLIAGVAVAGYVVLTDDDSKVTARSLADSIQSEFPTARLVACERDSPTFWVCTIEGEQGQSADFDVTVDAHGCWTAEGNPNQYGSTTTRRGCI